MSIINLKALETLMAEKGMSARALSLAAGLNDTAVRDILSGRSKKTRPHTIMRIAQALNCDPAQLLSPSYIRTIFENDPEVGLRAMEDLNIDVGSLLYKSEDGKVIFRDNAISVEGDHFDDLAFVPNEKISFLGANLTNASLRHGYLVGADFTGATLKKADLSYADLRKALFVGSNLDEADFTGADLSDAEFVGCSLNGTKLIRAKLSGADLTDVDLSQVIWG